MEGRIRIFPAAQQLYEFLGNEILACLQSSLKTGNNIFFALSGGNTPKPLFQELAFRNKDKQGNWDLSQVHFFWVDERCVPPSHDESNYRMANEYLFRYLGIGTGHIHRILGENEPAAEAERYAGEVMRIVPFKNGLPSFDWIFLGLGEDGHTASLFPDRRDLWDSDKLYENICHPVTEQARITMTPRIINNASRITFVVTGASKSTAIRNIAEELDEAAGYPANCIRPDHGTMEWLMDQEAALGV